MTTKRDEEGHQAQVDPRAGAGPEPACWNCQYFVYTDQSTGMGLCRRHAPPAPSGNGSSPWPIALNTDWCGEYGALALGEKLEARRPAARR